MVLEPPVREDPGVDARVERLDPTVEHLRGAGDRRHVRDGQARLPQSSGGAAGRDELEPGVDEAAAELREPRLVGHRQERPTRDRQSGFGSVDVDGDRAPLPRLPDRPGEQERDRARQQSVLDGPDPRVQRGLVVAVEDRDRFLDHDRAPVERRVDQMDGRSRHFRPVTQGRQNRMGAGERGQEARVRVQDSSGERLEHVGAEDPHVARKDDDIGPGGGQRLRDRAVIAARHQSRLDPLLRRPVKRGTRSIGEDEDDLAAQLTAAACRVEGAEVRALAGHGDRDAAVAFAHPRRPIGPST